MSVSIPTSSDILKSCFFDSSGSSCHLHVHLLQTQRDAYLQALNSILETSNDTKLVSTVLSPAVRTCILFALHATGHHSQLQTILSQCDVVDITKALTLLDRPRRLRQLTAKINKIEARHPHLVINDGDQQDQAGDTARVTESDSSNPRTDRRRRGRFQKTWRKKRGAKHTLKRSVENTAELEGSHQQQVRRLRKAKIYASRRQCDEIVKSYDAFPLQQQLMGNDFSGAYSSSAVKEAISSTSVSGALALKVRHWAKEKLQPDFLEFVLMSNMPLDLWKNLADLVHFHPNDFLLPYFLAAVHDGATSIPEGSLVRGIQSLMNLPAVGGSEAMELMEFQFAQLAEDHPEIYKNFKLLRTHAPFLKSAGICTRLARHIPLSDAVWYLEELAVHRGITQIVSQRLQEGEWTSVPLTVQEGGGNSTDSKDKVSTSFGKLLERIMTCKKRGWKEVADALMLPAETRLMALKEQWSKHLNDDCLTVVFGDASSSMQSAIEAATILATMVSVCWQGELSFFNQGPMASPHLRPSTVQQTLEVCQQVRAQGWTSLAAALWPYYEQKRKISRIVMVTDEEENTPYNGFDFAKLLSKYKADVYDKVELIVICVTKKGDAVFRSRLNQEGIIYERLEIDGARPDLTKFDAMLSEMAMLSSSAVDKEMDDFVVLSQDG